MDQFKKNTNIRTGAAYRYPSRVWAKNWNLKFFGSKRHMFQSENMFWFFPQVFGRYFYVTLIHMSDKFIVHKKKYVKSNCSCKTSQKVWFIGRQSKDICILMTMTHASYLQCGRSSFDGASFCIISTGILTGVMMLRPYELRPTCKICLCE